jgi:hypothetical protein
MKRSTAARRLANSRWTRQRRFGRDKNHRHASVKGTAAKRRVPAVNQNKSSSRRPERKARTTNCVHGPARKHHSVSFALSTGGSCVRMPDLCAIVLRDAPRSLHSRDRRAPCDAAGVAGPHRLGRTNPVQPHVLPRAARSFCQASALHMRRYRAESAMRDEVHAAYA